MQRAWITLITLLSVVAVGEVWAFQLSIPDAVVEEHLLEQVTGVTREGDTLRLETDVGTVTFVTRVNVGEGSARYYLAGHLRQARDDFYLVRVFGHEGRGYRLVSKKTGQTVNLYGIPTFSPDGNRFVDVSLDLDAGYHPNLIVIYKFEDNEWVMEWRHIYEGRKGPADPVWLNNSAIVFFEVTFNDVPTVPNFKKRPFTIERENNTWNTPRPLK
jgi:hypothetical protein